MPVWELERSASTARETLAHRHSEVINFSLTPVDLGWLIWRAAAEKLDN